MKNDAACESILRFQNSSHKTKIPFNVLKGARHLHCLSRRRSKQHRVRVRWPSPLWRDFLSTSILCSSPSSTQGKLRNIVLSNCHSGQPYCRVVSRFVWATATATLLSGSHSLLTLITLCTITESWHPHLSQWLSPIFQRGINEKDQFRLQKRRSQQRCVIQGKPSIQKSRVADHDLWQALRRNISFNAKNNSSIDHHNLIHPTRFTTSSVGQSVGLPIPRSSVRCRQKFKKPRTQIYMDLSYIDPQTRVQNYCWK